MVKIKTLKVKPGRRFEELAVPGQFISIPSWGRKLVLEATKSRVVVTDVGGKLEVYSRYNPSAGHFVQIDCGYLSEFKGRRFEVFGGKWYPKQAIRKAYELEAQVA